MKLSLRLVWYDLWVGFFYDREYQRLYFCPLPCVVICLDLLQWVRAGISERKFKLEEFENLTQNIFAIATFIYYMILVSAIVWWVR